MAGNYRIHQGHARMELERPVMTCAHMYDCVLDNSLCPHRVYCKQLDITLQILPHDIGIAFDDIELYTAGKWIAVTRIRTPGPRVTYPMA